MAEPISTEKSHTSEFGHAVTEPIYERSKGFYALYSHPVTQVRSSLPHLCMTGIDHGIGDDAGFGLFHVSRQVILYVPRNHEFSAYPHDYQASSMP